MDTPRPSRWTPRRVAANAALGALAVWWWGGGCAAPASFLADARSVTHYDANGPCNGGDHSGRTSAPASAAIFRTAAARARHQWTPATLWKGSTCAHVRLADGREARLRLSYYGGFFAIEGQRGIYVVRPEDYEAWRTEHRRVVFSEFVPRRGGQSQTASPSASPFPARARR